MSDVDDVITARTKIAIAASPEAGLRDVDVKTIDGIVYLRGEVDAEADKEAAEMAASQVEGVRSVDNGLTVRKLDLPPKASHA
jgi:hyperosmotically inducible periplasmic protein